MIDDADPRHARKRRHACGDLAVLREDASRSEIAGAGRLQPCCQHVFRIEAGIDVLQGPEGLGHQCRAKPEDQRKRQLRHNEQIEETAGAARVRVRHFAQERLHRRRRRDQGRRHGDNQHCHGTHDEDGSDQDGIDRRFAEPRHLGRQDTYERGQRDARRRETGDRSADGEHGAFDDRFARQTSMGRAERGPQGGFAASADLPLEEQRSEIRGGEQHE